MGTNLPPIDSAEILSGLKKIRRRRWLSHIPFFSSFVIAGFIAILNATVPGVSKVITRSPLFQPAFTTLMVVGGICILFISVAGLKCPRCGNKFHFGERYRNDFTRKCLHCGLLLNGSNAKDPI